MLRAWSVGFYGFRLIIRVESSEFRVSGLVLLRTPKNPKP